MATTAPVPGRELTGAAESATAFQRRCIRIFQHVFIRLRESGCGVELGAVFAVYAFRTLPYIA